MVAPNIKLNAFQVIFMTHKFYIGGEWVSPVSAATFPVIDPGSEEIIEHIPAGNSQDIDAAVKAARLAFDNGPWPRMSGAG